MFVRVLSAMITADWIDRVLRAREQRRLAEQWAHYAAQAPPRHVGYVNRRADVPPSGWDRRAPERPS